jgi:SAM-dependent methyltransferase
MLLSDLVELRNQLINTSTESMRKSYAYELNKVFTVLGSADVFVDQSKQQLSNIDQKIYQEFDNFDQQLNKIKQEFKSQFEEKERYFFQESYTRYENTINNRDAHRPEYVNLDRHLRYKLTDENEKFLLARVIKHSTWEHPGMIIHPGYEPFIDIMVANDPLYLIDERHELLVPSISKFNELYQNRLRKYVITENIIDQPMLSAVPNNQFGLCLVYNYLHFRPLEIIKKYLQELYEKLSPGGMLIITINDCDRAPGVKLVESKWCYYTPLSLVLELAQHLNYQVEFVWKDAGPATWIELRKPGELTSLRGGQTLAKILAKPIANSK